MRTRTRTTPVVIGPGSRRELSIETATSTVVFDQTVTNDSNAVPDLDGVETITDELPKMKRYGNCTHSKTLTTLVDGEFTEHWTAPGRENSRTYSGGYWLYLRFRTQTNTWLNAGVPTVGNFSEDDWAGHSFEALRSMRPSFNDGFSLANDLLELHQIRGLLRPQGGGYTSKSRIVRPSLSRRAASFRLWWDYGVAPLIDSAKSVLELLNSLPDKIRKIREQRGKIQTRHYSAHLGLFSNIPADSVVYTDSESTPGFKAYRVFQVKKQPTYHASLRFNYDVDSLSDLELSIRAVLEGTGLSNPASVAWNAIPFSFVLDWFANIDEWITSLLSEPVIPIIVRDFCHSIEFAFRTSIDGEEQSSPIIRTLAAYRDRSYYERRRAIPSTIAPLTLHWPTLNNIIDGVALLATREKGIKHSRKPPRLPWLNFGKVKGNQIR